MLARELSSDLNFHEAADLWLEGRSPVNAGGVNTARHISERTKSSYRQYIGSLALFFAGTKLSRIKPADLAAYQKARLAGTGPFIRKRRPHHKTADICPAGGKKVNQELSLLRSILILAGCWNQSFAQLYEPVLVEEGDVPRALSPEEQEHWLRVAASQESWHLVRWYSIVAFDTCMSTNEIRGLRIGDINLQQRVLVVRLASAKNKYRCRTIELTGAEVLWALEQLLERARAIGAISSLHYLLPFRNGNGQYDPTKPMTVSGIKKPWNEIRRASGLLWFRQYDTRHTAITRFAEVGTPIAVIKSFAGHVSDRMNQHYTHVSQSAQRMWRERRNTPAQRRKSTKPDETMDAAIRAEVTRQMAMRNEEPQKAGGPRLILFPGATQQFEVRG